MRFTRLDIPEIILCEPEIFTDKRGYFTELFRKDKLDLFAGYEINFCQDNQSMSDYGVMRGLHYQLPPKAQAKYVRVIKGKILDVVVDIRKQSKNFGKHISIELSSENRKQIFIPKGFAHGYIVLSDYAIVAYKSDNYYSPKFERGIYFDDPDLKIDWQIDFSKIKISKRDSNQNLFKDAEYFI